ncbi:MAG: hypothetical protein H6585_03310 [Flavobacteriales bacterium]|nr:hypothetical protein [Flavobacteriales bacterium]
MSALKKKLNSAGTGDGPCITMVIPTKPAYPDARQNHIILKNALKEVRQHLTEQFDAIRAEEIYKKLEHKTETIDLQHVKEGLGIYFSEGVFETMVFPYPVQAKTVIGESFDTSEVEAQQQKHKAIYVLALSKGATRLFKGEDGMLEEIINEDFPKKFEQQYQTSQSSLGAFTNYEESQVNHEREEAFMREVDVLLGKYMKEEDLPVVLMGVERSLSEFMHVSRHAKDVIRRVEGNYDYHAVSEVGEKVWGEL